MADASLRDNPPWGDQPRTDNSTPDSNPYAWQRHLHDKTQPEHLSFLRSLRSLLDAYGATTSVGEIGDDDALAVMASYTGAGDKLHMAYTFNLLGEALDARQIRQTVEEVTSSIGDGWPCWSIGNHDAPRVLSRVGGANADPALALVLLALMVSLRGSACVYQGEELALTEVDLTFDQLRDPYGITFWPEFKGRDGCRTPMPWQHDAPHAGFSDAEPWLPVGPAHLPRAVDLQEGNADSPLNRVRRFLAWRQAHPVLRLGNLRLHDVPDNVLLLTRSLGSQTLLAAFNLSGEPMQLDVPEWLQGTGVVPLEGHGLGGRWVAGRIELGPYAAYFGQVP